MAERRILYLTVLVASLVFYWAYREWLSWLVLVVVLCAPWLSLALSLRAMLRMQLRVACPEWVVMGQETELILMGHCNLPHPAVRGQIRGTNLMNGQVETGRSGSYLPTDHCGAWELVVIKAKVYDYLGLFARRIRKCAPTLTYILPPENPMSTPPDLTKYLANAFRPKRGGGYAENHELRLYRPGDNLHQIHWKLTAKTGKLILREPMEPIKGKAVVSLELSGDDSLVDRKLGRLLWVCRYLLEEGVTYEVHCLTGDGMKVYHVTTREEADKALRSILKQPLLSPEEKIDFIAASWRYHIGGDQV